MRLEAKMATDPPSSHGREREIAQTLDGRPSHPPRGASSPRNVPLAVAGGAIQEDPMRVGRYIIIRRLGQGGMGVVYLAYDSALDRKVAIKVLRREEDRGRERVQQEAQALAQVSHPNIVHVYEVGQSGTQIYIAMEYVSGSSFAIWQRPPGGQPPPVESILRAYLQAAAGLCAAHRTGLIHRDFKPDNVLWGEDGRARVLDFGLARALAGPESLTSMSLSLMAQSRASERLTHAGAVLGTTGYMSPEQVRGIDADERSDQFSFCAALYEALYQKLPFAGDTLEEYATEVLAGRLRPPPPREVPISVEAALRRGLSTDPAARYPSMQDLVAALEGGLHPDSESPATRKASRRFRWSVGLLTVALAADGFRRGLHLQGHTPQRGLVSAIVLFACLAVVLLVMRKTLLRRESHRRVVYFGMVIVGYLVLSRTCGYALGLPIARYSPVEMLGVGALFLAEAPNASLKYRGLAALAGLGSLLMVLWPQLCTLVASTFYPFGAICCVYFRLTAPPAAPESSF